jgi:Endonuclease NucS
LHIRSASDRTREIKILILYGLESGAGQYNRGTMTEKEMEDLLWAHPEKILNEPLTQFRRQQRSGVGRCDLIFKDRLGRLLVIELKRGRLERGAIDQLHDYFGMVKQEFPDTPVELMVVANEIPPERALACEKYDIEHRAISPKRFRDVAEEVAYTFASEEKIQPAAMQAVSVSAATGSERPAAGGRWSFSGTAHQPGDENDFLGRCDESRTFFEAFLARQKTVRQTRVTWNHESGFSLQFYFKRLGFVEVVWGFPARNRKGQLSKVSESLVFPFDFALRREVPVAFVEELANALAEGAPVVGRGKRPSLSAKSLTPNEANHVIETIFRFAEKAQKD